VSAAPLKLALMGQISELPAENGRLGDAAVPVCLETTVASERNPTDSSRRLVLPRRFVQSPFGVPEFREAAGFADSELLGEGSDEGDAEGAGLS